VSAYILPSKMNFSYFANSLFKNQVENATIKLRASDERNWPSFLYPEGTTYDESELDKGLFRGHVLLRVRSTIFYKVFLILLVEYLRGCVRSSLENRLHLPVIDQLPNLHRQRCTACGKSSQKPLHMLLSR
jgi:hypothetical protein